MELQEIYRPIRKELRDIEEVIRSRLLESRNESILMIGKYLLHSGGKRLRPALVTLSARVSVGRKPAELSKQVIKIASAVELIHMASLIHDDVVDHSKMRHNRLTVNAKWGDDTALILGDYLYSVGFDLISSCRNHDVLDCISPATRAMCEGELTQVCERGALNHLKEHYITIVKNKTANLFAACCQAGVLAVGHTAGVQEMMRQFGLNFGIAFQIVDDSMDLIGDEEELGKDPGADFTMGELTLPVINLLAEYKGKGRVAALVAEKDNRNAFREIKRLFINSPALEKTKSDAAYYCEKAKESLRGIGDSSFKESLIKLTEYVSGKIK